ncbi:MAG: serine hydrolase domain-containing protein [Bacteroidota bacterium]|nr:serine hydrolase domain-containing protein [Bacteroidota bacterium]
MICRFFTILFFFIAFQGHPQFLDDAKKKSLNQLLESYIDEGAPGMAVGIVKDGTTVFESYLGYANLEHRVVVDENTRFNIASNAKQFTALCILQLAATGKLKLEDNIRTYLPDMYQGIDGNITILQLLTHTSGVRDVYDLWDLKGQTWWQLFIGNADAMSLLKEQKSLNFEPGTEFLYSNSNYILLAETIKKITETGFDAYAQSMFHSLGMDQTNFLTNYMEIVPNKARPYGNWNGWKEYPSVTEIYGDGALFTTLQDQLRWEAIIQKNDGSLLPKKLVSTSQTLVENVNTVSYGFGLMFGSYKGLDYTYHNGSTGAYNATFLRFPELNTSIVVLSNNGNISTDYVAKQLADQVLELQEVNMDYPAGPDRIPRKLKIPEILGSYQSAEGTIITIEAKNDTIFRKIYQREPVALIQEKGALYQYASNPDLKIAFEKDQSVVTGFTIYLNSQAPISYKKLPLLILSEGYKKALAGTYFNEEIQTTIEIAHVADNEFVITKNGLERRAELLYEDLIGMNSYEIRIVRNEDGVITGLRVKNGRIKNVEFRKH